MQPCNGIALTWSITVSVLCLLLKCIFGAPPDSTNWQYGNLTEEENATCGTLSLSVCNANEDGVLSTTCNTTTKAIQDYWTRNELQIGGHVNVTGLTISDNCHVTLCDDQQLMGYCALLRAGVKVVESGFGEFLQSKSLSMRCTCNANISSIGNETGHEEFDRNYVGVVYSPYDKYWEPRGPNGTLTRVSWSNYTDGELRNALENISKKFSYISTYGMGTASNTSEWYEGDKICFVPKIAAEINAKVGYPQIRVSVGIFRKDDVNVVWKSKEMYNAIEAARVANQIFNGTVWGITVTSQYVSDVTKAEDAIGMINEVKEISKRDNLHLKVGIRIDKCSEFTAKKRPEDDTSIPAYLDVTPATYTPLTSFQDRLQRIAKISDYILCSYIPGSEYVLYSFHDMIKILQSEFREVTDVLHKINPKLKVIIETGVPSQGIGNGFNNSIHNLRDYWRSMGEFARKEGLMFHMFEAIDQPWKNIQDARGRRYDINGPNGADGFYGWWKRANNSQPQVYVEKILGHDGSDLNVTKPASEMTGDSELVATDLSLNHSNLLENSPNLVTMLIVSFFAFLLLTTGSIGYLCLKLRKAKNLVISPAYVEQFRSGGENSNTKDDNYAVALRIPYNRKYELPKENFHIDKSAVMGSGQCGIVLRGTIKGRSEPVAFKCTTPSSTVVDIKSLMSEIKILSYIGEHDNILCILGAYTRKIERGIVYVALEYCPFGSLESFLRKIDPSKLGNGNDNESESGVEYSTIGANGCLTSVLNPGYVTTTSIAGHSYNLNSRSSDSSQQSTSTASTSHGTTNVNAKASQCAPKKFTPVHQVDISALYKWAYQIASAMEFVSEKNVIHADLAARNVLLLSVDQVKVSDFGLSRKIYQEMGVVHDKDTPLPWRWMAPESLKHLVFSVESDMWAYGVTIWEIFSLAEAPYHGVTYDMQFTKKLEKGMRLPQPKYASMEIHDQLNNCWELVPNNRPSFATMKEFFLHQLKLTEE